MESKIIDYQKKLYDAKSQLQNILGKYKNGRISDELASIDQIYKEKIENNEPVIMVYGIYNAGKSSIINELMHKDVAPVDDRPTTDSVDAYKGPGYTMYDTPGVGAPIRHEEVTQAHLKKADVVVFVMSMDGSAERRDNYLRMKDIADSGKKIIIVLNDKDGLMGTNDEGVQEFHQKVYQNMQHVGINNVDEKFSIVEVNAEKARQGRLKHKEGMIERSNMAALDRIISLELKKSNAYQVMANGIHEILAHINVISKELQGGETDEGSIAFRKTLDDLDEQRKIIRQEMKDYIHGRTVRMGQELPDRIWAVKDDSSKVNETVQTYRQNLINHVVKELQDKLLDVTADIVKDLSGIEQELKNAGAGRQISVDNGPAGEGMPDFSNLNQENERSLGDFAKDLSANVLETKLAAEALTTVAEKVGLNITGKALTKLLPQFITKIPLPIPVPPLQILILGYSLLKTLGGDNGDYERRKARAEAENRRYQQQIDAENQARQNLQQQCIYLAEDTEDDLIHWVNDIIRERLGDVGDQIRKRLRQGDQEQTQLKDTLQSISGLQDDFHVMETELRAEN